MSRPGTAESSDNGASASSSNNAEINKSFPLEFRTGASTSAEDMGDTLDGFEKVCKDDDICTFAPANGAAAAGDLTTFNGKTAAGTWQFCVGDGEDDDTGTIDKVTLHLNN
jgi:hypothetical protein